ncbi:MAG: Rne/Rng family ribonuclease [Actinomycetota bacterium]|nr:Rne/Rng family ribonuclease [Actinomycetota bacterium]
MSKEMLVSSGDGETRVAIIENGQVTELYFDRKHKKSIVGNIYVGKVENVLPSLDAAFVDIGEEKNAFLYINEVVLDMDFEESEEVPKRIQHILKPNQLVVVQVTKDPLKSKGARLTTFISIPGRYLVLAPYNDGIGVSKKLSDSERDNLRQIAKEIKPKDCGIIVRTAAKLADRNTLKRDLKQLLKTWGFIQRKILKSQKPSLINDEQPVVLRLLRDLFSDDFKAIYVDRKEVRKEISRYLGNIGIRFTNINIHPGPDDLFEAFNVNEVIDGAIERKVWLKSGGFIVIDSGEALTSIDVNTGKYTSNKNASETILRTNLEAAEVISNHMRLRDIGGLIVIDFIDMSNEKDKQKVLEKFKQCLDKDKTKTEILNFSKFGLLEMTRKNVSDGILGTLCKPCPCCQGAGFVKSEETIKYDIERKIKTLSIKNPEKAFFIKLNTAIACQVIGQGGRNLKALENLTRKHIIIKGDDNLPMDELVVVSKGSYKEVEESSKPFREGDCLELFIEETYLHNSEDALARIDGYIIQIIGGKRLMGKRVTVKIKTISKTSAVAEII